jgi:predicted  nucleic acid-binding Zn-ribbon protein
MSEPEIFRRCLSCGASFRSGALFCPECGNATANEQSASEPADKAQTNASAPMESQPGSQVPNPGVLTVSHPSRQRLSPGSGNIERRLRPGMEKLRKGTNIVIDEAAYDPSLRFVLIAILLFLLFLFLLFLSKWIV